MASNSYQPHIIVLCEDLPYWEIAGAYNVSGFFNTILDVRPALGGYGAVLDFFEKNIKPSLSRYPNRHVVLLLDYKEHGQWESRLNDLRSGFETRVFVAGATREAEDIRSAFRADRLILENNVGFEPIGRLLAEDCQNDQASLWSHRSITAVEVFSESGSNLRSIATERASLW